MNDIHITLAVEGYLSEVVARKLLEQADRNYRVHQCLGKTGKGYLKSKINAFNKAAKALPFFVLTDQDKGCPPEKLSGWLNQKANKYLILRIAVMEVESWVMADREAFAEFLSVPPHRIPQNTDDIQNPKELLISLARRSRSSRLRADIVPANGSTATVGPDYNKHLSEFVQNKWNVFEAEKNSESLSRALSRVQDFAREI